MFRVKHVLLSCVAAVGLAAATAMPASAATAGSAPQLPEFFIAHLSGANEVSATTGQTGAGDPDGSATEIVEINGDQLTFAFTFRNLSTVVAGHIHQGAAGTNGAVVVPYFATALPTTLTAAAGSVTIDPALAQQIEANPAGFYANLHTSEFPTGAVRGQLHRLRHPVPVDVPALAGRLAAVEKGANEVPPADPDGTAVTLVRAKDTSVDFAVAWRNIGAPTASHIHQGAAGTNGAIVVPFFAAPTGLPTSFFAVAGTVTGLSSNLIDQINADPAGFYANVHTAEFPTGAVRGQLFRR